MNRAQKRVWLLAYALLLLGLAAGCSEDSDNEPSGTPAEGDTEVEGTDGSEGAESCTLQAFDRQPESRFPVGRAYYLPAGCDGAWTVDSGPGSATVQGTFEDGYRITPTEPGTYSLSHDAGETIEFTAVRATDAPFHNFNYYPTRSLAVVGDEIWVAGVQDPRVIRLGADDLADRGAIEVGGWPVALEYSEAADIVVVVQRADDTLGFIDPESGALIDSLWVGDEPSNLVIDGETAWVSLATEAAVAQIDLIERRVVRRVDAVPDPLAMALNADGTRLYVAMHRSGHPDRTPYESYDADDEHDIAIIDTEAGERLGTILDVGTTINGLLVDSDSGNLWVATTWNDTVANLADPSAPSFVHEVVALEPTPGEAKRILGADLTRQASSGGHAVSLHAMAQTEDNLWVVAEGSDLVVALDPETLEEQQRIEVTGRPRFVLATNDAVYVHGAQGFEVARIEGGLVTETQQAGADPRPADMRQGQAYFTGAGRDYAANWSCNSCHSDGLTDTLIWNAGPFSDRIVPRPFAWLEGTYPLGWAGYMSNVRNYALTVNTNVGIRPTTDEFEALWAYIASIMPPPAANGWTQRDGSLSEEALAGKELYEGDAGCAGCHATPLTTSRAVLGKGITEGVTDVPILVGIYRYNTWLKFGDATTLEDAVAEASEWLGNDLDETEINQLTRYVRELTGRDFFVLRSEPLADSSQHPADGPIELTFSLPVWSDSTNLDALTLTGPDGPVEASIAVDGRHVSIAPTEPLDFATEYTLEIASEFQSYDEIGLYAPMTVAFRTAEEPTMELATEYVWTVEMPLADPFAGQFDTSNTLPTPVVFRIEPTSTGGMATVDYDNDLVMTTPFVVDGDQLRTGPLAIPVGPSFADSNGIVATLTDEDGDGIADIASGEVTISGPGFLVPGVQWSLGPPASQGDCVPTDGDLTIEFADGLPTIGWGDVNSLGFYATSPGAAIPLGPGQVVTQGDAYFVLEAEEFPAGFAGPATWGVAPEGAIEATETHGGPAGGATLESGTCVSITVLTTSFEFLEATLLWP